MKPQISNTVCRLCCEMCCSTVMYTKVMLACFRCNDSIEMVEDVNTDMMPALCRLACYNECLCGQHVFLNLDL